MTEKMKPTHTQPGGFVDETQKSDDGVVNDSFGTNGLSGLNWPR